MSGRCYGDSVAPPLPSPWPRPSGPRPAAALARGRREGGGGGDWIGSVRTGPGSPSPPLSPTWARCRSACSASSIAPGRWATYWVAWKPAPASGGSTWPQVRPAPSVSRDTPGSPGHPQPSSPHPSAAPAVCPLPASPVLGGVSQGPFSFLGCPGSPSPCLWALRGGEGARAGQAEPPPPRLGWGPGGWPRRPVLTFGRCEIPHPNPRGGTLAGVCVSVGSA